MIRTMFVLVNCLFLFLIGCKYSAEDERTKYSKNSLVKLSKALITEEEISVETKQNSLCSDTLFFEDISIGGKRMGEVLIEIPDKWGRPDSVSVHKGDLSTSLTYYHFGRNIIVVEGGIFYSFVIETPEFIMDNYPRIGVGAIMDEMFMSKFCFLKNYSIDKRIYIYTFSRELGLWLDHALLIEVKEGKVSKIAIENFSV